MKPGGQKFRILTGNYAVCRLASGSTLPGWAKGKFLSITVTEDELSIVCRAEYVPAGVRAERDWRILQLVGPFPLTAVGVLASVASVLAEAHISLLAVGTFDTDYLLVKDESLRSAVAALESAGHTRET